ncbi:group I truncated hemoglobin [Nannocystaceae bacterium ST9]
MSATPGSESLFKRLGGYEAIDAAVDRFYAKVLADDRVRTFFAGVDMDQQIRKQRRFLAHVFGGPAPWDGKELRHAHRHMTLSDEHFDAVAGHLHDTLVELGVAPELVAEVMTIAGSTRADVLDR